MVECQPSKLITWVQFPLLAFNHIKPELTGYDWPVEVRRHVRCGLVEALDMRLVGDDSRGAQL